MYLGRLDEDGSAKLNKIEALVVCGVSWDVGTGWVGTHAWCNMESCSGKVQNRCVSFVMYLWELGSGWVDTHAWCNMESCSGKVQNRDVRDENLRV